MPEVELLKITKREPEYLQAYSINPRFACSYYYEAGQLLEDGTIWKSKRTLNKTPCLSICPECSSQQWYFSKIQRYIVCSQCNNKYQSPSFNNNKPNGYMSKKAQSTFRQCFNWLMLISNMKTVYSKKENKSFKFRINFITLTLPTLQQHSDSHVKNQMLQPFLRWLSKSHCCNSYIWKAEAQKNGNIHFHITTNKFIHWKSIRSKWNKILAANNYCKVYQDGTNDKGDAATQIKAVKNTKSIECYMMKYMMKNEPDKRKIEGRLWAASENLNVTSLVIDETHIAFEHTKDCFNNPDNAESKTKPRFTIYLYNKKAMSFLSPIIKDHFNEVLSRLKQNDGKQTRVEIESFN